MSFTPNKYLTNNSNVFLRDQQHAARLFVNDQFRLAPKHKFLFHVGFNINPSACADATLLQRHRNEINMLVKSADLPSINVSMETVNQYNRKKVIQYQHSYGEINIAFHDDNMGVINKLWQNYYSYYYADSTAAKSSSAYKRNATKKSSYITSPYGLDNGSSAPFFNYIMIYQMARHEFVSYKLINPVIKSWKQDQLSYSDPGTVTSTMTISYEAVAYDSGVVNSDNVEGFALEHYDLTPSPLQGNQNTTSASPVFNNTIQNNAADFINTQVQQVNTYQNTKQLNSSGTPGVINNLAINGTAPVSGIQNILFPTSKATTNKAVVATKVNLGK